jgi:hypothetical protein
MPLTSILGPAIGAALTSVQHVGPLIIGVVVAQAAIGWVRRVIEQSAKERKELAKREAKEAYAQFRNEARAEKAMIKREGGLVDSSGAAIRATSRREADEAYDQFDADEHEERQMIKHEGGTV